MLFAGDNQETLKVAIVDDSSVVRKTLQRKIVVAYNDEFNGIKPTIDLVLFTDGNELTLSALKGVHIVLSDIEMSGENGDIALQRLIEEAKHAEFILPIFLATTSLTQYHNKNNEPSKKAVSGGFIDGRDKIRTSQDLVEVMDICENRLGINWFKICKGRYNFLDQCTHYFEISQPSILGS